MEDQETQAAPKEPALPDYHLIVVQAFGAYRRGHHINDPAKVAEIMAGENAHHCNKIGALE